MAWCKISKTWEEHVSLNIIVSFSSTRSYCGLQPQSPLSQAQKEDSLSFQENGLLTVSILYPCVHQWSVTERCISFWYWISRACQNRSIRYPLQNKRKRKYIEANCELGSLQDLKAAHKGGLDPNGKGSTVVATDVLWSDPVLDPGIKLNDQRGIGVVFGPDITEVSTLTRRSWQVIDHLCHFTNSQFLDLCLDTALTMNNVAFASAVTAKRANMSPKFPPARFSKSDCSLRNNASVR